MHRQRCPRESRVRVHLVGHSAGSGRGKKTSAKKAIDAPPALRSSTLRSGRQRRAGGNVCAYRARAEAGSRDTAAGKDPGHSPRKGASSSGHAWGELGARRKPWRSMHEASNKQPPLTLGRNLRSSTLAVFRAGLFPLPVRGRGEGKRRPRLSTHHSRMFRGCVGAIRKGAIAPYSLLPTLLLPQPRPIIQPLADLALEAALGR
jgi:hypothetical protein